MKCNADAFTRPHTRRSKPEWWLKIKDNAIPEKWRDEIKQQRVRGFKLEDEHIDWIFDELKDYANARSASGIQVC